MASNVEPEEAQAILDIVQAAAPGRRRGVVEMRDFARPSRLGARRLTELSGQLRPALRVIERELRAHLRGRMAFELVELTEVASTAALAELAAPLAVLRFRVAGEPAWIVWDTAGAVASVETALGTQAASDDVRALSTVEQGILRRLLVPVATLTAQSLGLACADFEFVGDPAELGSWRNGGERADPRRLAAHLACEGPGGASTIRVLLPGIDPDGEDERGADTVELPAHLGEIPLVVSVELGAADIPLADLLAIQVGDVIPLGVPASEPVRVRIEEQTCSTGRLGSHHGNLAVRIEAPLQATPKTELRSIEEPRP